VTPLFPEVTVSIFPSDRESPLFAIRASRALVATGHREAARLLHEEMKTTDPMIWPIVAMRYINPVV
jgi:hypothetical protein